MSTDEKGPAERWKRVERVYAAAIEHAPAERDAFLDDACAGDSALRREVESLLGHAARAEGFIETPAAEVLAKLSAGDAGMTARSTVSIGRHIGLYRVVSRLGAGGMGEVYRARDNRLGRDVAIKVLPPVFAGEPERLRRFEQEARLLASLSHPNIGAIYGLEESHGVPALILELIEGPTLAERLARGPIPVNEALRLAVQIADALEAAHEKGIIHRDLKPANIKVTAGGTVKVLDFGIAKAFARADLDAEALTAPDTREGMVIGTPGYMSPEQARGQTVDKRTDIWAFGCVLFEMLAGRPAFGGPTATDTLAAILEREPDWSALPLDVPPTAHRMLRRCLEKDARRRLRDIGDARADLEDAQTAAPPIVVLPAAREVRCWLAVGGLAAVATGVLIGVVVTSFNRTPPATVATAPAQLTIPLSPEEGAGDQLAVSPDGQYIAWRAGVPPGGRLFLRALAERESRVISEAGGRNPFFSPDGQWLGFFEEGKLKKVPVRGGTPVVLAEAATGPRGATWGRNGTIVFAPLSRTGLSSVSQDGGPVTVVTELDEGRGETSHRDPHLLPGSGAVLFTAEGTGAGERAIVVASFTTGERRVLVPGGALPGYVATGHLLFLQARTLMAVRFDASTLQITGVPAPVVEQVTQYDVAANGSLLYATPRESGGRRLVWVDRRGEAEPLAIEPRPYDHPTVSPDGSRIVLAMDAGDRQVWVYEPARETLRQLTFGNANMWPLWTMDGRDIVYASNRPGTTWDIFRKQADGARAEEALVARSLTQVPRSISADGRLLAFTDSNPATGQDIWVMPLAPGGEPTPLLRTAAVEDYPTLSPDGRYVAYVSNESGRGQIYVRPSSDLPGKWQLSSAGGSEPLWAASGREIFYRSGEKMVSVEVKADSVFAHGKETVLFEGAYDFSSTGGRQYDVTRDGRRFLVTRREEAPSSSSPSQINVVLNWLDDLKRRVP